MTEVFTECGFADISIAPVPMDLPVVWGLFYDVNDVMLPRI
jgi:hypothetical protein